MDDWGMKPWVVFAERATKFRRDLGADSHPVISRDKHEQEWRDWYAYYGFRRMFASQEMMRAKAEKTVPTLSPFDFDAEFNPRNPSPEVPRDNAPGAKITDEMRDRHARLYPGLPGNHVPMPNEPRSEAAE